MNVSKNSFHLFTLLGCLVILAFSTNDALAIGAVTPFTTIEAEAGALGGGATVIAFVDIAKLRDYSLDPVHPEGKHKARVFASALGLSRNDAGWLRGELLSVALSHECSMGQRTIHGQRYVLNFTLMRGGKSAHLRSVWNVRPTEDFPGLITCFVL